jgi:glycosyltransferase involved in cell wall biosynthesis
MVNIHIYPSTFLYETRIIKQVFAIEENDKFNKIIIVARHSDSLKFKESISSKIEVVRIPSLFKNDISIAKIFNIIYFNFKVACKFRKVKPDFINIHSISLLPSLFIFKLFTDAKLFYDTHELESEKAGLAGFQKKIFQFLEKKSIKYFNHIITVSPSISKYYKEKYKIENVLTIRNIPSSSYYKENGKTNILKEKLNIPSDEMLFIYQGVISEERFIHEYINVFKKIQNKHLVFLGYGELEYYVQEVSNNHSNIHFVKAVSSHELLKYTSSADVGLFVIKEICLSYRYALPNKFFEYLLSGVPVITSDFEDVSELVKEFDCGWNVSPYHELELFDLINKISIYEVKSKMIRLSDFSNEINWNLEKEKYKALFE